MRTRRGGHWLAARAPVSAAMVLGTLFSLAAVRLSAPARPAAPVLASRSSIKSAECDDLRDAASDCIDRDILANSSLALSCGTVADIGLDHYCDENATFTDEERAAVTSLKASMSSCNLISELVSTCWTRTSTSCNACECGRRARARALSALASRLTRCCRPSCSRARRQGRCVRHGRRRPRVLARLERGSRREVRAREPESRRRSGAGARMPHTRSTLRRGAHGGGCRLEGAWEVRQPASVLSSATCSS